MPEKILITSALPYANGPLHFGHIAGAYLPADCYARFQRLQGKDVLFICGSDEHGVAITLSADLAGRSPRQHVDHFHVVIKDFFDHLHMSFDHYSRTTWPGHVETTQTFFKDLLANGYIEDKVTDQLYSEKEGRFLADRYVEGICPKCGFEKARGDECPRCAASFEATDLKEPRCKLMGSPLILKKTRHWFLRFDLFKKELKTWIGKKEWKPNILNFAKNYIDDLRPRAITRDSSWGIPVPLKEAEGKVFYVWFDAPIGYISATKEWAQQKGDAEAWRSYWCDSQTKLVNFIGKDNIPFHAVFFPAMIMGQNVPYKLVDELPANEFLNLEGRPFSKSEGWMVDLESFFKKFTPDQIRYTLAANAPETHDSEFTWKDFRLRCNSELLGKYGNFVNRTLVFAQNHCLAEVPEPGTLAAEDEAFLKHIATLATQTEEAFAGFHLRKASQLVMELAAAGNVYFDAKQPWKAAKDKALHSLMHRTIYCCLECIRTLALTSCPIIPDTANTVWELLGEEKRLDQLKWADVVNTQIKPGQKLPKPSILFQKIEDSMIEDEVAKLEMPPEEKTRSYTPLKSQVTFDDVMNLDLRVGQILIAERIPKSKKLLKLSVDIGFEKRTIVAGIGAHFDDLDILIGKKIVVVANLKPARLMGVESQGMLLAAGMEKGLELPSLKNARPGDCIS